MQLRFAVDKFELFEREVSLQIGRHDVAAARFNGAVDDENVTLVDACVDHGVTAFFNNESRISVFHEVVIATDRFRRSPQQGRESRTEPSGQ